MACLEGLVHARVASGESRLKEALGGFFGGLVRNYLPQSWAIITEEESLGIRADTAGNLSVFPGPVARGDGEVRIRHDDLAAAIRSGQRPTPGSVQVTFFTMKGQTAFQYLRNSFGL